MANPQEFSHITVTADDDDVVIQAGVVEGVAAEDATGAGDAADGTDEGASAADAAAADVAGAGDDAAPAAAREAVASSYRETTLEDLEAVKMSTTQKVIIAVAVLGVIAFAAWYLLAR